MTAEIHTSVVSRDSTVLRDDGAGPIAKMNCDRVARVYETLERLSFGGALQSCRVMFLGEAADSRRALLCGDGDGRFLVELLRANREVCADFVDLSAGMIDVARRRLNAVGSQALGRANFHAGDVRCFKPGDAAAYDLITAHFFLDCFDELEVVGVARKLASLARPGARLLLSDFRIPRRGIARHIDAAIVRGLYEAFRWTTGLRVTRLPDYEGALVRAGFRKERETLKVGGLLTASLWQKS